MFRTSADQEAFLREIERELSRIERERRDLGRSLRAWEAHFRISQNRNPTNEEKIEASGLDYFQLDIEGLLQSTQFLGC